VRFPVDGHNALQADHWLYVHVPSTGQQLPLSQISEYVSWAPALMVPAATVPLHAACPPQAPAPHVRVRVRAPTLHVVLQSDSADHAPHDASTGQQPSHASYFWVLPPTQAAEQPGLHWRTRLRMPVPQVTLQLPASHSDHDGAQVRNTSSRAPGCWLLVASPAMHTRSDWLLQVPVCATHWRLS